VILDCRALGGITINGEIEARGATLDDTTHLPVWPSKVNGSVCRNGGSVKIFFAGTSPSLSKIYAALSSPTDTERIFAFEVDANDAPDAPVLISPENHAPDVSYNALLSWSCSTETGNELEYKIYCNDFNPPTSMRKAHWNGESIYLSELIINAQPATTYYWKVTAKDVENGNETEGPVWDFTTMAESGTITVQTYGTDINGNPQPVSAGFVITGPSATEEATNASGLWSRSGVPLGEYTITYDPEAGYNTPLGETKTIENDGDSITFTATYQLNDLAPPLDFYSGPHVVDGNSVTFTWEATSDEMPGSGLSHYTVSIDGGSEINVGMNTSYAKNLPDGDHSVVIKAYDKVGRFTEDTPRNPAPVTVNALSPQVKITVSKNGKSSEYGEDRLDPPVAVSLGSMVDMTAVDGNGISNTDLTIYDAQGGQPMQSLLLDDTFRIGQLYTIVAKAWDSGGETTTRTIKVQVFAGEEVDVINGEPYGYPNPFDPVKGTTIKFYLSNDADIEIQVYNVAGHLVWRKECSAGADEGGKQDINEVFWDGIDLSGNRVAFGPYHYFILSDGKVIGKGSLAAYR